MFLQLRAPRHQDDINYQEKCPKFKGYAKN